MSAVEIPPEMQGPEINVSELFAAGWTYRDPEVELPESLWHDYLALIGTGNFHIVGMNVKTDKRGQRLISGQLLISPAGIANLEAFIAGAKH